MAGKSHDVIHTFLRTIESNASAPVQRCRQMTLTLHVSIIVNGEKIIWHGFGDFNLLGSRNIKELTLDLITHLSV